MSIVTRIYVIAAGSSVTIHRQADFLRCLDLQGAPSINVEFDNGDGGDLAGGLMYRPEGGFQTVELKNTNATSVTINVAMGKGTMEDNRATVNTGQTIPVRQGAPDVFTTIATAVGSGQATVISAYNALRKTFTLKVDQSFNATYQVKLGAGGGQNWPMSAGDSVEIETTSEIILSNSTPSAVSIYIAETAWSV